MEPTLQEARLGISGFAKDAYSRGYLVGIISFGSTAHVRGAPSRDAAALSAGLATLVADGTTNLAAALSLVSAEFKPEDSSRCVLVVTDGNPDDRDAAIHARNKLVHEGIDVIALGVTGADREFLAALSTRQELVPIATHVDVRTKIAELARLLPG